MLSIKSILDAVGGELVELFPDDPVYRDVTPVGFIRPATLMETGMVTMEAATYDMVQRSCQVKITFFVVVDEYNNSQVDELADKLSAIQAHFVGGYLQVGERCLDIEDLKGNYELDYGVVDFHLSWMDNRGRGDTWPAMGEIHTRLKEER